MSSPWDQEGVTRSYYFQLLSLSLLAPLRATKNFFGEAERWGANMKLLAEFTKGALTSCI